MFQAQPLSWEWLFKKIFNFSPLIAILPQRSASSHSIVMIIESSSGSSLQYYATWEKKRSNFTMCNLFCSILNHMIHSSRSSFSKKKEFFSFSSPNSQVARALDLIVCCYASATVSVNDNCKCSREVSSFSSIDWAWLGWWSSKLVCEWAVNEIVNIGGRINHSNFSTAQIDGKTPRLNPCQNSHAISVFSAAVVDFFLHNLSYDIFIRSTDCSLCRVQQLRDDDDDDSQERWKAIKNIQHCLSLCCVCQHHQRALLCQKSRSGNFSF